MSLEYWNERLFNCGDVGLQENLVEVIKFMHIYQLDNVIYKFKCKANEIFFNGFVDLVLSIEGLDEDDILKVYYNGWKNEWEESRFFPLSTFPNEKIKNNLKIFKPKYPFLSTLILNLTENPKKEYIFKYPIPKFLIPYTHIEIWSKKDWKVNEKELIVRGVMLDTDFRTRLIQEKRSNKKINTIYSFCEKNEENEDNFLKYQTDGYGNLVPGYYSKLPKPELPEYEVECCLLC